MLSINMEEMTFDKNWQIYEEQLASAHTAMAKAV